MHTMMITAAIAAISTAALGQPALINPGVVEAIGPKQDDPLACPGPGGSDEPAGDPRVSDGTLAIGPKQDDPRTADASGGRPLLKAPGLGGPAPAKLGGKFDPETDPHAMGGEGAVAIGPKQDDPTAPGQGLAIGPKQDDPTAPGQRGVLAMEGGCGNDLGGKLPKPGR